MLCGVVFEEVGDGGVWTAGHLGLCLGDGTTKVWSHNVLAT